MPLGDYDYGPSSLAITDHTETMQTDEPQYFEDPFAIPISYSPPFTPIPELSLEEEMETWPDDEFHRSFRETCRKLHAASQKEVEALGFSSWKEKRRHDKEENQRWLEQYIEEHGHPPPPPTLTEEQKIAQQLQIERSRKPDRPPHICHCSGSQGSPQHSPALIH